MVDTRALAERLEELHALLGSLKRRDHLYPSNTEGDVRPSITVSSLVLQVLSEIGDPTADLVYRAIVAQANGNEPPGPWPAQGGGQPHTIAAAWAIFATSRARLDAVRDMVDPVAWLLTLQDQGGWPHVDGARTRPFHTALVLNALLAYSDKMQFDTVKHAVVSHQRVMSAVEDGIDYLRKNLSKATSSAWLWDARPRGDGVCLATSSLCLHVGLRASGLEGSEYLTDPTTRAIRMLAETLGRPETLRQTMHQLPDVERPVPLWPLVAENEPIYWYAYFTPLLALTFADAIHRDPDARPTYLAAIRECVRWTVEDYVPLGNNHSARGVWAVANALLVLRRAHTLAVPLGLERSEVALRLRNLGANLIADPGEFAIVCDSVDESIVSRIVTPATPESRWHQLIDQVASDPGKVLRLMVVVVDRYPASTVAREIASWLTGRNP